jgi:hypothetical protein
MTNTKESDLKDTKRKRGNPNWGNSLPYSEVRLLIKSKNFKNMKEYREWVREERLEGRCEGYPFYPQAVYIRKNEWISVKHFLGHTDDTTPSLAMQKHRYPTNNVEQAPRSVAWRIIQQIFGIGKHKQLA